MGRPVVITGGGTGGHLFPMQAIAERLEAAGVPPGDVRFVGSRRGQEARLLGGRAEPLTLLPGRGLRRSLAPRALGENLGAVIGLLAAVVTALGLLVRWRPRAVVSLGGYASAAVDAAAVVLRRPLVLVDFDARPGATHRLARPFARRICTSFPLADRRAIETGAPLRAAIESVDRTSTRTARLARGEGADSRWCLVVMTGSLGARSVNTAVIELAELWRDRDDLEIIHVTGRRDHERCVAAWRPRDDDRISYRQVDFSDMADLWARCDLALCRAGAITVAELTCLGIPAVLVPLPGSPGDHQLHNARAVAGTGGAVVLEDQGISGDRLAEVVAPLLDEARLTEMSQAALSLGRRDGAARIAEVVLEVAR